MRRILFLAGVLLATQVGAQAPAEERQVSGDALAASQQRLGVLRQEVQAAEERLKQAEQESQQAAALLEQARERDATATRALESARRESTHAQAVYQRESAAFDSMRKGVPGGSGGQSKAAGKR